MEVVEALKRMNLFVLCFGVKNFFRVGVGAGGGD